MVLRASVERAAWRELHALTVKAVSQNSNGGPAALQNVSDDEAFDLWVGGLVANKAKPVDTTESVFHVPAAMLGEPSQTAYEKGVRHAENTAFRVMRAVSVYHRELGDNLDRPEMKNRRQQIQNHAAAQFWTDVESAVPRLLERGREPGESRAQCGVAQNGVGTIRLAGCARRVRARLSARDTAPDSSVCAGSEEHWSPHRASKPEVEPEKED